MSGKVCFALGFLLVVSGLVAEDYDLHDFDDMSLEELLNIKVTVASKRAETIQDAPGVITLYTSADMNRNGYYTLADLAEITPGYGTVQRLGTTFFETRGQIGDLNAKHLLLIDGIPVNHSRDYMAFSQEQLPLLFTRQVEFLRGPASALYGVSAFYGVVNVTSKSMEEDGTEFGNRLSFGNSDAETGITGYMLHRSGGRGFHLSYGFYDRDDSLDAINVPVPDWVGAPTDQRLRDNQQGQFLNFSYQIHEGRMSGLRAGVIFMGRESGYGESWTGGIDTSELNQETRSSIVPYIRYEQNVGGDWWVNSYLKFNRSVEEGIQENDIWGDPFYFQFKAHTDDTEFLIETRRDFNEYSSLIVGLNYDVRAQDDDESFLFNPDDPNADQPFFEGKAKTSSLYTQFTNRFAVGRGLLLTLGARFDRGEIENNEYDQVSPRIAVVQKLTERLSGKVLLGSALKAPGVKEVGHNTEKEPSLVSPSLVPNVGPETIETQELALSYAGNRWYAGVTLYNNETEDVIVEAKLSPESYAGSGDEPGFFQNLPGSIEGEGLEIDLKFRPSQAWSFFANLATADVEDSEGQALPDVPELKFNLGMFYAREQGSLPWEVAVIAKHIDQYSGPVGGDDLDGQTVLDSQFTLSLLKNTDVQFQARNLFDEDYTQFVGGFPGVPMPGRRFLLSVNARF